MHYIRYIIAGGCTTVVNFGIYTALTRGAGLEENLSNIIAVTVSVLFAYMINKLYVFRSKVDNPLALAREFVMFAGARVFTIAIDIGGLYVLFNLLKFNDLLAKVAISVIIMVLNYLISRFLVFRKKQGRD
ncbi:MAG: GtrA family protein [Oscillospiraceae bacterium]|nr:GtrA family protein [Oscillospiraceae bacterium]